LFFKDSFHTLIIRILSFLFALIVQILIARLLGPSAKGELQIVMFLMVLVALIVGMGFERAIIFYVGQKVYDIKKIWANACLFLFVSAILACLVLLPGLYFTRSLFGEIQFGLLMLIFVIVPVELLFAYQLGIFNGLGQMRKGNMFSLCQAAFFAILAALFIGWLVPSSRGVLYAYFLSYLFTAMLVLIYWKRAMRLTLSFDFDSKLIKNCLGYSTKGQLGNIANRIATRMDLVLLNYFLGKSLAGVYSVAINFADLLLFFPLIFSYVVFPHTSRRDQHEGWKLIRRVVRISFLLSIVLSIGIAITAPFIIPALFGDKFAGAVRPLWILLPGVILLSTFRVMASGISGLGYPFIFSACTIVMVVTTLILNLILVPAYEEIGAAVASAVSYALGFITLLCIVKIKFKHELKGFLIPCKEDFIMTRDNFMRLFNA